MYEYQRKPKQFIEQIRPITEFNDVTTKGVTLADSLNRIFCSSSTRLFLPNETRMDVSHPYNSRIQCFELM